MLLPQRKGTPSKKGSAQCRKGVDIEFLERLVVTTKEGRLSRLTVAILGGTPLTIVIKTRWGATLIGINSSPSSSDKGRVQPSRPNSGITLSLQIHSKALNAAFTHTFNKFYHNSTLPQANDSAFKKQWTDSRPDRRWGSACIYRPQQWELLSRHLSTNFNTSFGKGWLSKGKAQQDALGYQGGG